MDAYRAVFRLGLFSSNALLATLLMSCGAAPVRSTVDAYGESGSEEGRPLCFIRDRLPLRERPIADACLEAARARGLTASFPPQNDCIFVSVTSGVVGSSQRIETSPTVGSSVGFYGSRAVNAVGIGLGTGSTEVRNLAERELSLQFFRDSALKQPIRTIDVRSAGSENSAAAVAYEMCEAAFREYPVNLRGEVYEIPRTTGRDRK